MVLCYNIIYNARCYLSRMDAVNEESDPSSYHLALYGLISFLLVMLIVMLLYVACSRKYRLNWFEKNLLETAETTEMRHRWETLRNRLQGWSYSKQAQDSGSGSFLPNYTASQSIRPWSRTGGHESRANRFRTLAPTICGFSVWKIVNSTVLVPVTFEPVSRFHFGNFVHPWFRACLIHQKAVQVSVELNSNPIRLTLRQ